QILEITKKVTIPNHFPVDLWRVGQQKLQGPGIYTKSDENLILVGYIGDESDLTILENLEKSIVSAEAISKGKLLFEVIGTYQSKSLPFGKRIGLPKSKIYEDYVLWLHKRVNWDIGIIYSNNN